MIPLEGQFDNGIHPEQGEYPKGHKVIAGIKTNSGWYPKQELKKKMARWPIRSSYCVAPRLFHSEDDELYLADGWTTCRCPAALASEAGSREGEFSQTNNRSFILVRLEFFACLGQHDGCARN